MKEAQEAASIIERHYRVILESTGNNRSVAQYFMQFPTLEHKEISDELVRLISNIRCLNIKDPRLKRRDPLCALWRGCVNQGLVFGLASAPLFSNPQKKNQSCRCEAKAWAT